MSDGQIDWSAIHRRLEAANAAVKRGFSPSPEERKKILRKRADLLARRPDKDRDGDAVELVEFTLDRERYGIESGYVREVHPPK